MTRRGQPGGGARTPRRVRPEPEAQRTVSASLGTQSAENRRPGAQPGPGPAALASDVV